MDDDDRRSIIKRYPPEQRESAIDRAIRDAQARGDFDDLPGKGRPIDLTKDGDGDEWLATRMLKGQGFVPAWIEDDRAIAEERRALEELLERHVAHAQRKGADVRPEDTARVEAAFRERAERLNRVIDRHNLAVPSPSLQRRRVAAEAALAEFRQRLPASEVSSGDP